MILFLLVMLNCHPAYYLNSRVNFAAMTDCYVFNIRADTLLEFQYQYQNNTKKTPTNLV